MPHIVTIQNPYRYTEIPSAQSIQYWATYVLHQLSPNQQAEICIRIVDEQESAQLNNTYRHKTSATNILSFPFGNKGKTITDYNYLGDIAICAPLLAKEALEQDKTLDAHWAHLVIHGILHLLGFDHIEATEAQQMEQSEITLLQTLGYKNPYGDD